MNKKFHKFSVKRLVNYEQLDLKIRKPQITIINCEKNFYKFIDQQKFKLNWIEKSSKFIKFRFCPKWTIIFYFLNISDWLKLLCGQKKSIDEYYARFCF